MTQAQTTFYLPLLYSNSIVRRRSQRRLEYRSPQPNPVRVSPPDQSATNAPPPANTQTITFSVRDETNGLDEATPIEGAMTVVTYTDPATRVPYVIAGRTAVRWNGFPHLPAVLPHSQRDTSSWVRAVVHAGIGPSSGGHCRSKLPLLVPRQAPRSGEHRASQSGQRVTKTEPQGCYTSRSCCSCRSGGYDTGACSYTTGASHNCAHDICAPDNRACNNRCVTGMC
jgi:hypothetical protein